MPLAWRTWLQPCLDILLPPRCSQCGVLTQPGQGMQPALCADCWQDLTYTPAEHCKQCGELMLDAPYVTIDTICGECQMQPPAFHTLRAALVYTPAARQLILRFKTADQTQLADLFATWLVPLAIDWWQHPTILVPVPLHWQRLWWRRYNQAGLIAQAIQKRIQHQGGCEHIFA